MNVPLLDLKQQYASIQCDLDVAIREVMESQHFILGPKSQRVRKRSRSIAAPGMRSVSRRAPMPFSSA